MNDWYIDRSKNFVEAGLRDILRIVAATKEENDSVSTVELGQVLAKSGALGEATANPSAALTRYRDHGLLDKQNNLSFSAKCYLDGKYSFGELITDLFIKRFAEKGVYTEVRPLVLICILFSTMFQMGINDDEIFTSFSECDEYLVPITKYEELTPERIRTIINNRQYTTNNGQRIYNPRRTLQGNLDTNYSIWFNALRQTPLFIPDESDGSRSFLKPNTKQKALFNFISENAKSFVPITIRTAPEVYSYYCNHKYGFSEIIPNVMLPDIDVDDSEIATIFEYLFGYDKKVQFSYNDYFVNDSFGVYFPFISIPNIAISKIEETNPIIANKLYNYAHSNHLYYLQQMEDFKCVKVKGEEVAMTTMVDNKSKYRDWLLSQTKENGEKKYSDSYINTLVSALNAAQNNFNVSYIYSIDSIESFVAIEAIIRNHENFASVDYQYGNGGLSASLNLYMDFLKNKNDIVLSVAVVNSTPEYAWYVGATGTDEDGQKMDYTEEFINGGIWVNGWTNKFIDEVKSIKVGDSIALKSSFTQKNNLPFDNSGKVVGAMRIKAIGTVTENPGDGKTIKVKWTKLEPYKTWYGQGVMREAIHCVNASDGFIKKQLLLFTFNNEEQDYSICEEHYQDDNTSYDINDDNFEETELIDVNDMSFPSVEWFKSKAEEYAYIDEQAEPLYRKFQEEFSIENLKSLSGINLLRKLFYNDTEAKDNLCYYLEHGSDYKLFGGIGGGAAQKFVLFYKKAEQTWKTGSAKNPKILTEEEAIELGTKIRDELVTILEILENIGEVKTKDDYNSILEAFKEKDLRYYNWTFVEKFLHIMHPELFPTYYNWEMVKVTLKLLNLEITDNYMINFGSLVLFAKECGLSTVCFGSIMYNEKLKQYYEKSKAKPADQDSEKFDDAEGEYDIGSDEYDEFQYEFVPMIPKQSIVYGAPGTSKSYSTDLMLFEKYPNEEELKTHIARVVFHPDYTYGDFVGAIQPVYEDKVLKYDFVNGPFTELLERAYLHSNEEFYLIIEELNRGNAASIFGDIFQLLDRINEYDIEEKRFPEEMLGRSRYAITNIEVAKSLRNNSKLSALFTDYKIWLPSNFNIICTMNTADQNVYVLDSAFKRRFNLEYTEIDFSDIKNGLDDETAAFVGEKELNELFENTELAPVLESIEEPKRNWPTFAQIVNSIIDAINEDSGTEKISEDKKLGPYFVTNFDIENKINFVNKVIYYLKQDVFKYEDAYFVQSFQKIYSMAKNDSFDVFELLKKRGE